MRLDSFVDPELAITREEYLRMEPAGVRALLAAEYGGTSGTDPLKAEYGRAMVAA